MDQSHGHAARGEHVEQLETDRIRKDGQRRAVALTVSPIRDSDGKVVSASVTGRDITDRMRAEEALRESERFAHSTLDALTAQIAILDENGTILAVNQSWRAFAAANGPISGNVEEGATISAFAKRMWDDSPTKAPPSRAESEGF